jgi:glycosyltransferase involved in cell wall biosynthesis
MADFHQTRLVRASSRMNSEVRRAVDHTRHADIVIGVPSYNSVKTIGHVVRVIHAGLAKYFPKFTAVIVNSDSGSSDGTPDAVLTTSADPSRLLILSTPLTGVHRLMSPYHGIPGRERAFRLIFEMADVFGAEACAVVDSDVHSITPEWIDVLIRPVLHAGYDLAAPYYHRHKYDGTITSSIVYPLTRALYGRRIRQPIGGHFGLSRRLIRRYLSSDDWETDAARYGTDIWMTTIAVAEQFRTCQSFLGAKLSTANDPSLNLAEILRQVVGSVFSLMREYEAAWLPVRESAPIDLFGFPYDVELEPAQVNVEGMLSKFRAGCSELEDIWSLALAPDTLAAVQRLRCAPAAAQRQTFHLDDKLWARIIYDFACAYCLRRLERAHLLRSLTPLYLARVVSFVSEIGEGFADQVEDRIEALCQSFESAKPYLEQHWRDCGLGSGNDSILRQGEHRSRYQMEVTQ